MDNKTVALLMIPVIAFVVISMSFVCKITKPLDYKITQNGKVLGYSYSNTTKNGCKRYYSKDEEKIGNVCGNFKVDKR